MGLLLTLTSLAFMLKLMSNLLKDFGLILKEELTEFIFGFQINTLINTC